MSKHISGIQQIGIGIPHVHEAWAWYRQNFFMDIPVFEEAATAALMLPYTGNEPRERHAILAINALGGGGFEIWQYTSRVPQAAAEQPQLGDLGIFICKLKSRDVEQSLEHLRKAGSLLSDGLLTAPDGRKHFFAKDPYGNLFEVTEFDDFFSNQALPNGGVAGVGIGVSDMNRALAFYGDILGYRQIVSDQSGRFDDLSGIASGSGEFRRVLLRHSETRNGAFSRMLGRTEIELFQALDRQPHKIFEGRFWGDLGFIHLCFDVSNMQALKSECEMGGYAFTVDSSNSFDMGEAAGHFTYTEDPDGTLIEFVETHRIPILKKIGWYLDLRKRDPRKPLPNWMLRALALNRKRD